MSFVGVIVVVLLGGVDRKYENALFFVSRRDVGGFLCVDGGRHEKKDHGQGTSDTRHDANVSSGRPRVTIFVERLVSNIAVTLSEG